MTPNAEEEVREASWRRNQVGLGLEERNHTLAGGEGNVARTENHTEPGTARESPGVPGGHMRDKVVRWAGAGLRRVHARPSGFLFEMRRNNEGVCVASGKISELCFRGGSREATRKLCQ